MRVDLELSPEDADYFYSVDNRKSGHVQARGGGWSS